MLDLFKAVFFAGLPVAVISYYLIILTSKKATLKSKNARELKKELKSLEYKEHPKDNFVQSMVHKKFLKFGGGFYGVLAFITYIHIEIMQIINFIRGFSGFQNFLDGIGFSMLLGFIIEAIMNLVQAFMWPVYWYKYLPIGSFWVWILVAIFAHTVATRRALSKL